MLTTKNKIGIQPTKTPQRSHTPPDTIQQAAIIYVLFRSASHATRPLVRRGLALRVLRVTVANGEGLPARVGSVRALVVLDVARAAERGGDVKEGVPGLARDLKATATGGYRGSRDATDCVSQVQSVAAWHESIVKGRTGTSEGLEVRARGSRGCRSRSVQLLSDDTVHNSRGRLTLQSLLLPRWPTRRRSRLWQSRRLSQ